MKANKRVRDLKRNGKSHLAAKCKDGVVRATTTFPTLTNAVQRSAR